MFWLCSINIFESRMIYDWFFKLWLDLVLICGHRLLLDFVTFDGDCGCSECLGSFMVSGERFIFRGSSSASDSRNTTGGMIVTPTSILKVGSTPLGGVPLSSLVRFSSSAHDICLQAWMLCHDIALVYASGKGPISDDS